MKNQHTTGPWHLNTLEVVPFSIHAHGGCVAEVSRGTMNEVSADEIEANAKLIATAPDLLATAEQIEFHCPQGDINPDERYAVTLNGAQILALRRTLAKARGGEQK